jgi:hypothetical protein
MFKFVCKQIVFLQPEDRPLVAVSSSNFQLWRYNNKNVVSQLIRQFASVKDTSYGTWIGSFAFLPQCH